MNSYPRSDANVEALVRLKEDLGACELDQVEFFLQIEDEFGLSIPEWRTLAVLGRFAPLTATGVVARTAMDKVRVSRAVSRLLADGLLERAVDPADRRRAPLRLSRKGRRIYEQIVPLALRREAELLDCLNAAETQQLDRLLAKLQAQADRVEAA